MWSRIVVEVLREYWEAAWLPIVASGKDGNVGDSVSDKGDGVVAEAISLVQIYQQRRSVGGKYFHKPEIFNYIWKSSTKKVTPPPPPPSSCYSNNIHIF